MVRSQRKERNKSMQQKWENLDPTLKVFIYLSVSTILSEILIDLGNLKQTLLVRISAQLINLAIVFIEKDLVPVLKRKLKK